MIILAINAGSSSLKFTGYRMPEEEVLISGVFQRIGIDNSFYTIKINGEKLYLSPLLDLYNDEIISYELTKSPTIEVVKRMVAKGKRRLKEGENPILHTDQGCQYRSASYQKYLKENNIRPSMSKKGTCLDNAKAENLFSIIKNEFYYIQKFKDEKDFRKKLDVYIKYYNEKRIKERLNWMSPVEYRNTAPLVA